QRRGAPAEVAQQTVELASIGGILARAHPRLLKLGERRHQRLGHVLAAVAAETVIDRALGRADEDALSSEAPCTGTGASGAGTQEAACSGARTSAARSAVGVGAAVEAIASKNARNFASSLCPGARSVPLAVSTAYGCTRSSASATLLGSRPPLRISGVFERLPASSPQSNVSPVPPRRSRFAGDLARASAR